MKDSKGFIWFATDNGICRFDGSNFKIFSARDENKNGLTESLFLYIYQKSENEILFLSYWGHAFIYSYESGKFLNLNEKIPSLKDKSLEYLYKDKKNNYWFCTQKGLLKTDLNFNKLAEYEIKDKHQDPTVNNKIITICEDKKGILWLGLLSRAVMRFDPITGMFSQKELKALPKLQQVKSIINDRDSNYVFIATGGEGLFRINIHDFSSTNWRFGINTNSLPSDRVISICQQSDSVLWIGTLDGLAKLNFRSNVTTRFLNNPQNPYSLINQYINHVYLDSQNILWVSTFGGISKLNTMPERFTKVAQNPMLNNTLASNKICHCITDRFGNLWVATSKGIDVKEANGNRYYHYDLPRSFKYHKNEEIVKFFIDDNTWWVGTWGGGVSRFVLPQNYKPGNKLDFKNFYNQPYNNKSLSSNFIRSFAKDQRGNLWVTTWNGGLNKINASDKKKDVILFTRYFNLKGSAKSVASNFIDGILVDADQNFWLGTSAGLQKINFDENISEMYHAYPQNMNDLINSTVATLQDSKLNIWHGNFGGLIKIVKNADSKYSQEIIYNNSNRGIYSLVMDKNGVLWFSTTNSEIGCYNPQSKKIKFYSMVEEVNGFDFYFGEPTIDKDGRIYFVGNSGYLYFNPHYLPENKFVPPVAITSIKIGNEDYVSNCDVSRLKEIEVDYNQRYLTVGFATLNYIYPERNQYKYILEGFDKNWVALANKNEISFTNLPAGKYKLKIIGSNNDEVWNYYPAELSIVINPPFWQNNYYRIAFAALLGLGVFMYFNSKIKRLKHERRQQNQFSELLIKSQEEERKRLSQELHDSLGQNLLVIKNQLDLYQNSEPKDENEVAAISDLIKESISEVKEISSYLHPHQLERLGLSKAISAMINKLNQSSNLEISTALDDVSKLLPKENEINIYRIIQESLNNILKHSGSAKANVEIKKEEGKFFLIIEDFGKGFDIADAEMQNKFSEGLGLKSIRERVRLLNGNLQIDSCPGKGTKILITVEFDK